MNEKQLSWLGGLWDGEGSITVWKAIRSNNAERYNPSLVLTNTSDLIINEATKILDLMGVRMHIILLKRDGTNAKDCYQLTTRKLESVQRFCEVMIPYLIGKRPQAELTLRFIKSRLKNLEDVNGKGKGCWKKSPYSEEEISLSEQLQRMNKKGRCESSETKRLTL